MPVKTCSSCGYVIIESSRPCPSCEAISYSGSSYDYDAFISFKYRDKDGTLTEDGVIAAQLYEYLKNKGLRVFLSVRELDSLGKSRQTDVIDVDRALETSRVLIAVGCSRENLESEWVRYEWDSFLNDIRSDFKQNCEVYVLYRGMEIADLPRALRHQPAFNADDKGAFDKVYKFIQNDFALERERELEQSFIADSPTFMEKFAGIVKAVFVAFSIALLFFTFHFVGWLIQSSRIYHHRDAVRQQSQAGQYENAP